MDITVMWCFLFDVDGTLTPSRLKISESMKNTLKKLKNHPQVSCVAIVGGSNMKKQKEQLGEEVLNSLDYVFSENGLVAFKKNQCFHRQNLVKYLGEDNYQRLVNTTMKIFANLDLPVKRGTFLELRSGMLNISPIGRSCSQEERMQFYHLDQQRNIRDQIIIQLQQQLQDLNLAFVSGGQISIDIFPQGWDKRYCLQHFDASQFDRIFFFGDRTSPTGNDHLIYKHLKGFRVTCPQDTEYLLNNLVFNDMSNNLIQFNNLYHRWQYQQEEINWDHIKSISSQDLIQYEDLSHVELNPTQAELTILKLNGGLGTSMGCTGPKSILPVRQQDTFLDILLEQAEQISAGFVLMNSFFTHDNLEMQQIIKNHPLVKVNQIIQSKYPRILEKNHQWVASAYPDCGKAGYYPPGHGDVYPCIQKANLSSEYIFISNCDNLDATYDPHIFSYLKKNPEIDFLMEMTPKTDKDVKGGTVFRDESGLRLIEVAEVPANKMDLFLSAELFNTNNIWLKTNSIPAELPLRVICNKKKLQGEPVIQLETAMGDAIRFFNNPKIMIVPRSRFSPVKKNTDLDRVRNFYDNRAFN